MPAAGGYSPAAPCAGPPQLPAPGAGGACFPPSPPFPCDSPYYSQYGMMMMGFGGVGMGPVAPDGAEGGAWPPSQPSSSCGMCGGGIAPDYAASVVDGSQCAVRLQEASIQMVTYYNMASARANQLGLVVESLMIANRNHVQENRRLHAVIAALQAHSGSDRIRELEALLETERADRGRFAREFEEFKAESRAETADVAAALLGSLRQDHADAVLALRAEAGKAACVAEGLAWTVRCEFEEHDCKMGSVREAVAAIAAELGAIATTAMREILAAETDGALELGRDIIARCEAETKAQMEASLANATRMVEESAQRHRMDMRELGVRSDLLASDLEKARAEIARMRKEMDERARRFTRTEADVKKALADGARAAEAARVADVRAAEARLNSGMDIIKRAAAVAEANALKERDDARAAHAREVKELRGNWEKDVQRVKALGAKELREARVAFNKAAHDQCEKHAAEMRDRERRENARTVLMVMGQAAAMDMTRTIIRGIVECRVDAGRVQAGMCGADLARQASEDGRHREAALEAELKETRARLFDLVAQRVDDADVGRGREGSSDGEMGLKIAGLQVMTSRLVSELADTKAQADGLGEENLLMKECIEKLQLENSDLSACVEHFEFTNSELRDCIDEIMEEDCIPILRQMEFEKKYGSALMRRDKETGEAVPRPRKAVDPGEAGGYDEEAAIGAQLSRIAEMSPEELRKALFELHAVALRLRTENHAHRAGRISAREACSLEVQRMRILLGEGVHLSYIAMFATLDEVIGSSMAAGGAVTIETELCSLVRCHLHSFTAKRRAEIEDTTQQLLLVMFDPTRVGAVQERMRARGRGDHVISVVKGFSENIKRVLSNLDDAIGDACEARVAAMYNPTSIVGLDARCGLAPPKEVVKKAKGPPAAKGPVAAMVGPPPAAAKTTKKTLAKGGDGKS